MYVDPATVEPVTELPAVVAEVVIPQTPTEVVGAPASWARPAVPAGLAELARDARTDAEDQLSRRSLALALLDRGWDPAVAGHASGLGEDHVRALGRVRRPVTASSSVADDLVAARRPQPA